MDIKVQLLGKKMKVDVVSGDDIWIFCRNDYKKKCFRDNVLVL